MNPPESATPARSQPERGRFRMLAATCGLIVALGGGAAWVSIRQGWWLTPTQEAERALDAGDLGQAGILLSRIIQNDPRQAQAQLLYARLCRLSGMPREADVALAKAMDLGVPESSLWREYGLLLAEPDFRQAEPILLKALRADPGDSAVLRALADGLSRQGRWPEAADRFSEWLRTEPNQTEALLGRSQALVQSGQALAATAELRKILAREPDHYEARLLLANCFLSNADMEQAVPELERCCRLRPDRPEPLTGLAGCAIDRNDLARARDLLDRAVALDPSSLVALTSRANLALNLRQYDLAIADLEHVVGLDPANKLAHLHLAQLYHRSGDRAKAAEHEEAYRRVQTDQEEKFRVIRGIR